MQFSAINYAGDSFFDEGPRIYSSRISLFFQFITRGQQSQSGTKNLIKTKAARDERTARSRDKRRAR